MDLLFPISLKIEGRKCIVIGGGEVAAQKVDSLLVCGGQVTVVSPSLCQSLAQKELTGSIHHRARDYQEGDLDGAFLVIAATDDNVVNRAVYTAAQQRGALINVVDVPEIGRASCRERVYVLV